MNYELLHQIATGYMLGKVKTFGDVCFNIQSLMNVQSQCGHSPPPSPPHPHPHYPG